MKCGLRYSATLAGFELINPVVRFAGAGDSATAGSHSLVGLAITYDLANNRARIVAPAAAGSEVGKSRHRASCTRHRASGIGH